MNKKDLPEKKNKNWHYRKLVNAFESEVKNLINPTILEFGVSNQAMSTQIFLDYCKKLSGKLYSIDTVDFSFKFIDNNWNFIQSRDDEYEFVKKKIPDSFDLIFLDTLHNAFHVEKIIFLYFKHLKVGGSFFIDDISWLPYCVKQRKDHENSEINNYQTFKKLLEIYNINQEMIDLEFSFVGTGIAKIKKIFDNKLHKPKKIYTRNSNFKSVIKNLLKNK